MKTPLFLIGTIVATGITGAYLFDEKKGPKRRKILKKRANRALDEARNSFRDCSEQFRSHISRYSKQLKNRAGEITSQGRQ